jgi:hypothetical protein
MALLVPATAQPGTPGVLGWNRCKRDRVWRKLVVHWFAAERQNGNSGLDHSRPFVNYIHRLLFALGPYHFDEFALPWIQRNIA